MKVALSTVFGLQFSQRVSCWTTLGRGRSRPAMVVKCIRLSVDGLAIRPTCSWTSWWGTNCLASISGPGQPPGASAGFQDLRPHNGRMSCPMQDANSHRADWSPENTQMYTGWSWVFNLIPIEISLKKCPRRIPWFGTAIQTSSWLEYNRHTKRKVSRHSGF
jgi:hypothetical protein